MITTKQIITPLGKMLAGATEEGICLFEFPYRRMMPAINKRLLTALNDTYQEGEHPYITLLEKQMKAYFEGSLKEFDLPLHFVGTDFQKSVWKGLLNIPYGETRSYKQQSIFLGNEKAIRAVAGANGENCIAIIIPCHRVIGENGSLTGYGGGLPNKKWLLEHERRHSGKSNQMEIFGA